MIVDKSENSFDRRKQSNKIVKIYSANGGYRELIIERNKTFEFQRALERVSDRRFVYRVQGSVFSSELWRSMEELVDDRPIVTEARRRLREAGLEHLIERAEKILNKKVAA